jgi:hypothetical protein
MEPGLMKLLLLALPTILTASLVGCAVDTTDESTTDDDLTSAWSESVVNSAAATGDGCFEATYPSNTWEAVDCVDAPNRPFATFGGSVTPNVAETVGNGDDYQLQVTGKITTSTGSFPTVKGVTSESDSGTKNGYSIQLNSNFMSGTAACKGVKNCLSWSQFVYSSEEKASFVQNWLIGIGTCPSASWNDDGQGDCFINSKASSTPVEAISTLATLKMAGSTTSSTDSLVFTVGTKAFKTSQKDTLTDLSTAWTGVEFNIIGDGGGSEAVFNKGSSVTVQISVKDGSTAAPTCAGNAGTTGETNNLKLGACKASSGSSPSVTFTETD